MSDNDLNAFRDEMRRRGVYDRKYSPRASATRRRLTVGDMSTWSVKRLALAFGNAHPDSENESKLYRALVEKVEAILKARAR